MTGENEKILPSETPVHIPAIERHPTYKLQEQFPTSQKCLNPVCNASLPTTPAAHRVRECHPKVAGVRSSGQGSRSRRSHQHQPPRAQPDQSPSIVQQLLDPRNLLRRLLPASFQLPQTLSEPKATNQNFENVPTNP